MDGMWAPMITAARMLEVLREIPHRQNMRDVDDRELLIEFVVGELHQATARLRQLRKIVEDMRAQGKSIPYRHGG